MEFGIETVAALGLVALVAGFFDSIAGGGGLLTVPALLLAGFDPVSAIATNKLQGSFGTASATFSFARAGRIAWAEALPMAAVSGAASVAGALAVQAIPAAALAAIVPFLMLGMALYFGLSKGMGDADARSRVGPTAFTLTLAPIIGFYDGFFGPGAGSFYMVGFVTLLGFGLLRATAHTKALNLASNVGSLALYAASGLIVWPVGLVMGVAALTGAQIGSRLALRMGARLIRPLIVVVCCAVALRLLMDPANPARAWLSKALAGG
ncbi:TSUP family transporter [Alsobacter sp. SYSU M60028]|uniref:Probable membrane transporter protein n=1 Tax=Alsobacter ponti TaxID=2962936 RepID=A0ABT1LAW6_9HYPH|nr:TSUP family transporter [Alsobacter ponti]MCP8938626.1 TSUP family transporter [Alsobacter ponti]